MMPDESAQEAALQSGELSMMRITNPTKLESMRKMIIIPYIIFQRDV